MLRVAHNATIENRPLSHSLIIYIFIKGQRGMLLFWQLYVYIGEAADVGKPLA